MHLLSPVRPLPIFALIACLVASAAPAAAAVPSFEAVVAAVEESFAAEKGFEPSDLISRKQAAAALDRVERLGWQLKERKAIEKKTLDDGAFLVERLRTTAGKKFMRQVASMPMVYDRLDRMSEMSQGHSTIDRLIKGPDGYKLLDYMTRAKGGHELTKMLSKDGQGNYDRPTGKLYTVKQLLDELKELHATATQKTVKS